MNDFRRKYSQVTDKYNNLDPGFMKSVALGMVPGYSYLEKFGVNPDIDIGIKETIWDAGGPYVPPTAPRIHNVKSTSAEDAGTIVSSGSTGVFSMIKMTDVNADFVSDGVQVGDTVIAYNLKDIGARITSVDSATEVTVFAWLDVSNGRHVYDFNGESDYRIVRPAGDGVSIYWVQGLDGSLQRISEFTVLNGITDVPTEREFFRQ